MSAKTAVGWDIHRKFSQLSVVQQKRSRGDSRREANAPGACGSSGHAEMSWRSCRRPLPWRWKARSAGPGSPTYWTNWASIRIWVIHRRSGCWPRTKPKPTAWMPIAWGGFGSAGFSPKAISRRPKSGNSASGMRYRMALVQLRTGIKSRIQAILHRQGVSARLQRPVRERRPGLSREARSCRRLAARRSTAGWRRWICWTRTLAEVEAWMQQHLEEDEITRLLQTIPGIGLILAHVIRAEIGQLAERFPSRRHLTSYSGLAPLAKDSADRQGTGTSLPLAITLCAGPSSKPRSCVINSKTVPRTSVVCTTG